MTTPSEPDHGSRRESYGGLTPVELVFPPGHQWQTTLIEAARDATPVSGLTHNHYRYPARFSPRFVRAAIEAFTAPGDVVLDPFVGGGTTLVEALALGRHSIGVDITNIPSSYPTFRPHSAPPVA